MCVGLIERSFEWETGAASVSSTSSMLTSGSCNTITLINTRSLSTEIKSVWHILLSKGFQPIKVCVPKFITYVCQQYLKKKT